MEDRSELPGQNRASRGPIGPPIDAGLASALISSGLIEIEVNVSVKGNYALRAVFELSSRSSVEPMKIADIASRQSIPQKFLELILSQLKQGGFLGSRRGASGGYYLARAADTITVGDVLRHIEGPLTTAERSDQAGQTADAPFADLWKQADQALSGVLDQTTFADLVRRWQEKHSRRAVNWQI